MFEQIVVPEPNPALCRYSELIRIHSRRDIIFHDSPASSPAELAERCRDADAILVGWASRIPPELIEACPKLKHIGLACTLFEGEGSNVDLPAARVRGISVTGVRDYGDIGVAEWVVSEAVQHCQAHAPRRELSGMKAGVVGAGGAGAPTALKLLAMGADVRYFSRSPKERMEKAGIPGMDLAGVFEWSEMLTFHLPRNTVLGGKGLLARFGGSLVINTSLGLPLEGQAVIEWLGDDGHYASFDADGIGGLDELKRHPSVRYLEAYSGFTTEAELRLVEGVAANLAAAAT